MSNNKYYMISIIGTKKISTGITQQVLWHTAYKLINGVDIKEGLMGQAVINFEKKHPKCKIEDFIINQISIEELNK